MFDTCDSLDDRAAPAGRRAEARARRLERLADIGLDIAEKLQRQADLAAVHSETDAVPDNLPHSRRLDEIARAFAQVSRAVSVATALEDRIDRGLPALPDDDRPLREREAREKRAAIAGRVVGAIEADPGASRRRIVRLRLDLDRLLDAELADLDRFLRRPFHEIEARLRRDLGLDADDDPSPERGRMGPVAQRREDGVTSAGVGEPPPSRVLSTTSRGSSETTGRLERAATPSSPSPPANGAHPSPFRGRIVAPP